MKPYITHRLIHPTLRGYGPLRTQAKSRDHEIVRVQDASEIMSCGYGPSNVV